MLLGRQECRKAHSRAAISSFRDLYWAGRTLRLPGPSQRRTAPDSHDGYIVWPLGPYASSFYALLTKAERSQKELLDRRGVYKGRLTPEESCGMPQTPGGAALLPGARELQVRT